LAGFGLVEIQRRLRNGAVAASILLIALANVEALRAPIVYRQYLGVPPVYDRLKNVPTAVVACFPFYPHVAFFGNARYMLASTRFWKPLLNGFSGFAPPSFYRHTEGVDGFPDRKSIAYLKSQGVTHIVVDGAALSEPRKALLPSVPELSLWASDGT